MDMLSEAAMFLTDSLSDGSMTVLCVKSQHHQARPAREAGACQCVESTRRSASGRLGRVGRNIVFEPGKEKKHQHFNQGNNGQVPNRDPYPTS